MNSIVFLAPVNHFDPLGRAELITRLRLLRDQWHVVPGFVAVEYGPEQHRVYVEQRPQFRQMLAHEWPDLRPGELDTLEQSLAYDGDAHRDVFLEATILWLDKGRQFTRDQLAGYAQGRLGIYRVHASGPLGGRILQLSQQIRQIAAPPEPGDERDRNFAEAILAELGRGSLALVIVGANHATEAVPDTMAAILRESGVNLRWI